MANGHGGKRKGAGRKPVRSSQIEVLRKYAAQLDVDPVREMLDAIAFHKRQIKRTKEIPEQLKLYTSICCIAKDCAPYIHPKLAATDVTADVVVDVEGADETIRQSLKGIAKLIATHASGDGKDS